MPRWGLFSNYFLTPLRGLKLKLYTSPWVTPTAKTLRPDGDCPPPLSFCEKVGILLEVEEAVAALTRSLHQVAIGTELLDHVVGRVV